MKPLVTLFTTLLALVGLASAAEAKSVFLNNVNIDGVVNQKFENCSVEIDAQGNIHIVAKGYKVETVEASTPTPATPPPVPTKRYWLVTEKPSPGMDQYDIEVYLNNQSVRKISSKDEQMYLEISKYMRVGQNTLYIVAKKNIVGERKSTSLTHYSRLIFGEGDVAGKTIMINKQLLEYKRTAAETTDFAEQFSLEGR